MADTLRETFTVPKLAKFWGCHVDAIYTLIREGKLAAFLIKQDFNQRKRYRISLEAVRAYERLASAVDKPATAPARSSRTNKRQPKTRHFENV